MEISNPTDKIRAGKYFYIYQNWFQTSTTRSAPQAGGFGARKVDFFKNKQVKLKTSLKTDKISTDKKIRICQTDKSQLITFQKN